jgi:hypothetical protein
MKGRIEEGFLKIGRTDLFYLPKYFRKVKGKRDVLTLCAMP